MRTDTVENNSIMCWHSILSDQVPLRTVEQDAQQTALSTPQKRVLTLHPLSCRLTTRLCGAVKMTNSRSWFCWLARARGASISWMARSDRCRRRVAIRLCPRYRCASPTSPSAGDTRWLMGQPTQCHCAKYIEKYTSATVKTATKTHVTQCHLSPMMPSIMKAGKRTLR